jgi:hypothetical protein
VVHDDQIEVVAAEVGVTVGGLDLEDAVAELQDRDVEGAATEVVDDDFFFGFLVEAVGEGGGGGLVDDALDLEAGDFAGVFGGLSLGVVEVGGHGDDGFGDGAAQEFLGVGFEFAEDHGRDFFGRVFFVAHFDFDAAIGLHNLVGHELEVALDLGVFELAADEALNAKDGVVGVDDGLALGDLADQALTRFADGDHARRGAATFGVGDNSRLATFHDGHGRVGGSEVDSDDFTHVFSLFVRNVRGNCPYSSIFWHSVRVRAEYAIILRSWHSNVKSAKCGQPTFHDASCAAEGGLGWILY